MKKNRWKIYMLLAALVCCAGCGKKEKQDTGTATVEEAVTEESPATQTEAEQLPDMDAEGYYVVNDSVEVSVELADVRVSAEADADIYMMAEQGTVLSRTGYNDMWTRVELQNTSFYVLSDTVTEITQPTDDIDTPQDAVATPNDAAREKKVVIDPGNQAAGSVVTEAIGPGSDVTKACASEGITGSTFGTKESELNLEYALSLKTELESRGYEVVLTRESDNVDLSNQARANIANSAGASAFIRIEMNESSNAELDGVMAVCMTADTPYNSDLYNDSRALATRLLQGITETADVTNRGIYETDEMTAINWSDIPVAEIHLGFLSNATDEGNLLTEAYKEKLITGIANGLDYFMQ